MNEIENKLSFKVHKGWGWFLKYCKKDIFRIVINVFSFYICRCDNIHNVVCCQYVQTSVDQHLAHFGCWDVKLSQTLATWFQGECPNIYNIRHRIYIVPIMTVPISTTSDKEYTCTLYTTCTRL